MKKVTSYTWTRAQQDVIKALKGAIGKKHSPTIDELALPPEDRLGDVSYPCFALAQGFKRNPSEIATELAAKIGPKGMIASVQAKGPYVNFTLDLDAFGQSVIKEVLVAREAYGRQNIGKGR
ncbi:hypothetical protein HYV72_00800, partial [Candidatus Uhrbacteria bacterium]|nr:hypothetical protein [Candidatus Uhrbacteria bacterium]